MVNLNFSLSILDHTIKPRYLAVFNCEKVQYLFNRDSFRKQLPNLEYCPVAERFRGETFCTGPLICMTGF